MTPKENLPEEVEVVRLLLLANLVEQSGNVWTIESRISNRDFILRCCCQGVPIETRCLSFDAKGDWDYLGLSGVKEKLAPMLIAHWQRHKEIMEQTNVA